ncbi:MAG: hypothetical protein Q9203_007329, partial [Teloschistes exilis]
VPISMLMDRCYGSLQRMKPRGRHSISTVRKNAAGNDKDEEHDAGEGCVDKKSSTKSDDIIESRNNLTVNDKIERTAGPGTIIHHCQRPATAGNDDGLNGYYIWSRLLEKYCRTRLTFERDKLVAISSLAQLMQTQLHH